MESSAAHTGSRSRGIKRFLGFVLALAGVQSLAPVPRGAAAPVAPLTLATVRDRTLASSPTLRAAQERTREAGFVASAAGAPPNPELSIGHGFGIGATGTDEDILLTRVFEITGKQRLRGRVARSDAQAARFDEERVRQDVLLEAERAYYDTREAAAALTLAQEGMTVADTFVRLAQEQFDAGDVPRTHVVRSRIEQSDARQVLRAAEAAWDTRRAVLNMLMGEPADAEIHLDANPPTLTAAAPAVDAAAARTLVDERADLRAARLRLEAKQAAVALAGAERRPDFVAQAAHAHLQDGPGNVLRLGLVLPLWDGGRIRANVAAARSAVSSQTAQVEAQRRQALLEVESAYLELERARAQAVEIQSGPLGWTRELRMLIQTGYTEGESSYLELLDAQRTERATALAFVQAVAAYDRARAALEHAAGVIH